MFRFLARVIFKYFRLAVKVGKNLYGMLCQNHVVLDKFLLLDHPVIQIFAFIWLLAAPFF